MRVRANWTLILALLPLTGACSQAPFAPSLSTPSGAASDNSMSNDLQTDPVSPTTASPTVKDPMTSNQGGAVAMPVATPVKTPVTTPVTTPDTGLTTPCQSVDWTAIKKPEDFLCLGSREKIFENFPEWLKPFFTLMHTSQSAQAASLDNPRIIVTSPEGSYIFGASTDPEARADIEIAVYDYTNEVWQFAGIDFSTSPPKVEKELCKTCHGQILHTNWTSYKEWKGAYGQPDLSANQQQIDRLEKFRKKGTDVNPLLKALKYKDSYTGNNAAMSAASGLVETETNEMMGVVMTIKASRSLAARVLKPGVVTKAQLTNILYETLCTTYSTFGSPPVTVPSLTAVNLPAETYLAHLPPKGDVMNDSIDRGIMFVGFESAAYWFGLTLLERVMAQDPSLKTLLPDAAAMFTTSRYRVAFTPITSDFLAVANQVGTAWVSTRDEVNRKGEAIFPNGGDSSSCKALKTYTMK